MGESCPRQQAHRNGLAPDGQGVPVDGQLYESQQIRNVLGRDEPLGASDLGEGDVLASGNPQKICMPTRVTREYRQPRAVARGREQARVAAY